MNSQFTRRRFNQFAIASGALVALRQPLAAQNDKIKMFKCLGAGHIGVQGTQRQLVEYAIQFGFGGVNAQLGDLEKMSQAERDDLVAYMKQNNIRWGIGGLPVQFRNTDEEFQKDLKQLPERSKLMQSVGIDRICTWLMPGHNEISYMPNFKRHAERLRACAEILKDNGQRLGLEYVGTPSLRNSFRYHFLYSLPETLLLIEEIGTGNVGFLLDTWHWHTAGDTVEDIKKLRKEDIVEVQVNDAQKDVPLNELQDGRRLLPCKSGVIDTKSFINAVHSTGFDGPVDCEPFNQELRDMDNEAALKETIEALNCVFDMIEA